MMKLGDTGKDIWELQEKLVLTSNPNLGVDGVFGGDTEDAVILFQKLNTLLIDGIAGPKTLAAIDKALKPEIGQNLSKKLECHLESPKANPRSRYGMAAKLAWGFGFTLKGGLNDLFHQIVNYLDVERSERYQEANGKTYCNIYAYDYCSFTWAFLPRVYWKDDAFNAILSGETAQPVYAENVHELNADMLFEWLWDEGALYHGWERLATAKEAQGAVNNGAVGLVCADKRGKGSGHITVILPGELKDGALYQSQAGATNKQRFHSEWYLSDKFADYGFFVNYSPR